MLQRMFSPRSQSSGVNDAVPAYPKQKQQYTEKAVLETMRKIFLTYNGQVDLQQFSEVRRALDREFSVSDSFRDWSDKALYDIIDSKGTGIVCFQDALQWQLQRLRQKKQLIESTGLENNESDSLSLLVRRSSKESTGSNSLSSPQGASSNSVSSPQGMTDAVNGGFGRQRRRSDPTAEINGGNANAITRAGTGIIGNANYPNPQRVQIAPTKAEASSSSSPRPNSKERAPRKNSKERAASPEQCPGPNHKYERGQWRLKTAAQIMGDLDVMEQTAKKARELAKAKDKDFNFKRAQSFKTNDTTISGLSSDDEK